MAYGSLGYYGCCGCNMIPRPAYGESQGVAVEGEPKPGGAILSTLVSLAPAAATLIQESQDPYRQVEIYKFKLEKARREGASLNAIKKLEAKLVAAQQRVGIRQEAIEGAKEFSQLGKLALVTGIGVGAALILLILMRAFTTGKASHRRRLA